MGENKLKGIRQKCREGKFKGIFSHFFVFFTGQSEFIEVDFFLKSEIKFP